MKCLLWHTAPGEETKPDPAESKGQAGKPELPQQEPSVTPGSSITIPEAKNIAPEPKVEAPKPATKEPAAGDDNPFAIFSQCKLLLPLSYTAHGGETPNGVSGRSRASSKTAQSQRSSRALYGRYRSVSVK